MKRLSNWGLFPAVECTYTSFAGEDELRSRIHSSDQITLRGNGRSYGDASLGTHVLSSLPANNLLAFDAESGVLTCQAGCLLSKVLDFCVPRGWFLPVTPGTRLITVGGAVASDVHGKNHHKHGSFGSHVLRLSLMTEDGSIQTCGPDEQPSLFQLTCGGMGMTGAMLEVTLQLIPIETAYIKETILPCANLDAVMDAFEANEDVTYSVAWIDCLAKGDSLGRSLLMLGEHAALNELSSEQTKQPLQLHGSQKLAMPFPLPQWVLNSLTIRSFNALYYRRIRGKKKSFISHYSPFFYPLDSIGDWNRMYGKRGFIQYQFVLPRETSRDGMKTVLERISASGKGSFLAVLKLLGRQETGVLSFPMEGYTLSLDFPMDRHTPDLVQELDALVEQFGGRIYLAKDALMTQNLFDQGYPRKQEFIDGIRDINPNFIFQTKQTQRLGLTPCPPS